jgi:hypothetical protein
MSIVDNHDFHPIVYEYDDFTPAELEAMRASLKQVGLLQSIVIWKNLIVDGKHRENICREERINRTYKDITLRCPTEEEMRAYVAGLNQHRRSRTKPLTDEEKRAKAESAIVADPTLADKAIAEKLGDVSQPTVCRARKRLEAKRVIPRITPSERKSRTGKVGEGARKTPKKGTERPEPDPRYLSFEGPGPLSFEELGPLTFEGLGPLTFEGPGPLDEFSIFKNNDEPESVAASAVKPNEVEPATPESRTLPDIDAMAVTPERRDDGSYDEETCAWLDRRMIMAIDVLIQSKEWRGNLVNLDPASWPLYAKADLDKLVADLQELNRHLAPLRGMQKRKQEAQAAATSETDVTKAGQAKSIDRAKAVLREDASLKKRDVMKKAGVTSNMAVKVRKELEAAGEIPPRAKVQALQ